MYSRLNSVITLVLIIPLFFGSTFIAGAESVDLIQVQMPDGSTQQGIIKEGKFIPLKSTESETTVAPSQETGESAKKAQILPAGTPVQIAIDKEIDADDVKEGDMIPAHVVASVKHNGQVVFPAGTTIKGVVTERKNNFIFGVSGKIELGEFKIMTPNGGVVPLSGNYQRNGNSRVAGSLVGGYFLVLPLFIKGQDGKVPRGSESTMYTAQEWEYRSQE